ncbi:hypothetical protein GW17_00009183 [Ensete ventricosum]|nr:hypothetical protein GW17_00009183 [Ensete ventricosum]
MERMGCPSGLEDGNLGEGGEGTTGVGHSSLIFLGTGCSNTVPNARCLIQPSDPPCAVCCQSLYVPPEKNPNYRSNSPDDLKRRSGEARPERLAQSPGDTLRRGVAWALARAQASGAASPECLAQSPGGALQRGIAWALARAQAPGIILTHEHADAIFGLDDVRIVQSFIPFSPSNDIDPTPVYATKFTMDRRCKILVSQFISKSGEQLDLLIIDTNSLHKVSSRSTHLCFSESLDAVKRICPKQALLIGMTHDYDHHKLNVLLAEWSIREGIPVQLAYDGLRVFIDL